MLTFSQTTGEFRGPTGILIGTGFSGLGGMRNNPASEDTLHGVIPKRTWTIFLPRPIKGSWQMFLKPQMPVARTAYGQFSIQAGDPKTLSNGCIVLPPAAVAKVVELWNKGERTLQVTI
jgi:hypothetical protein